MDIAEFSKKVDVTGFIIFTTNGYGKIVAIDYQESADEAMASASKCPNDICYVLRGARFELK